MPNPGIYDFDTIRKEIDRIRKEEGKDEDTVGTGTGITVTSDNKVPEEEKTYNGAYY